VYRAPGRVNLIGEHTDYNLGFVLPIAMHLACFTARAPNREGLLQVYSANNGERHQWPLSQVVELRPSGAWTDYVVGVAQQIVRLGYELEALDIAIYSTVPVGSGLSSSAAIEVSTALALLGDRSIERLELAQLAQRAEREFVGVPCGIMDQYVSVFGEAGKAVEIDCRSLTHKTAKIPEGTEIVAVNSMVKHDLGSSAYATRVGECAEAVEIVRQAYPDVTSLRDVSSPMLERVASAMPETVYRRACHVVTENERVEQFVEAAQGGRIHEMGRLFLASHRSLQHDYEVSAEELDFLVDTASDFTGVYGSRMTGGGFGGCTVNLVSPDRVDLFKQHITEAYRRRFGHEAQTYDCIPANGAGEI
jgi:galactokinase